MAADGTQDALLEAAYDHLMAMLDDLDAYRSALEAEAGGSDRPELVRLIGLQTKRVGAITAQIEERIEPSLRDVLDRLHVVREARAGRFN